MTWDEWRGSLDGRATLWIKRLFGRLGRRVDLHKFVGADDPECFHTHPAYAIRIILWGGYIEELEGGKLYAWRAGDFGVVRPTTSHRVLGLIGGGPAYTLWIRGRRMSDVQLRGSGWSRQA